MTVKKCFTAEEIRPCSRLRDWLPEYAIKNVWPQVRDDEDLIQYLPDEEMDLGRWPDRRFFWGILSTLRREWVEKYVHESVLQRDKMQLVAQMRNRRSINISDRWKSKLLEHDFASRQKGK